MRRRWDPFKVTEVTPTGGPGASSTSQPPGGAESATSKLRALFARHRTPILVAAGAAVAGAAYLHRSSAEPAESLGAGIDGYAPADATGADGYDSTGNDVYNALQPQIEQTQDMLTRMLDRFKRWRRQTRQHGPKKGPKHGHGQGGPKRGPKHGHGTKHHGPKHHHGPRRPPHGPLPVRRAAAPAPHRAQSWETVVARRGQTLSGIAAGRGVDLRTVQRVNPTARQGVQAGQRVVIPVGRRRRR